MSVIETFFNTTATNTRKTTATPTSSDSTATISSFAGVLRPVTEVAKLFIANNIGREFDYVAAVGTNVAVGDYLYISTLKYSVIGVATYEDLEDGIDGYVNIRITKK